MEVKRGQDIWRNDLELVGGGFGIYPALSFVNDSIIAHNGEKDRKVELENINIQ